MGPILVRWLKTESFDRWKSPTSMKNERLTTNSVCFPPSFPPFFPKTRPHPFLFFHFSLLPQTKNERTKNILVKRKGSLFSAIMSTGRICPCLNDTEGGKASGDSNTGSNSDSTAPARHSGKERNCNSFFVLNHLLSHLQVIPKPLSNTHLCGSESAEI